MRSHDERKIFQVGDIPTLYLTCPLALFHSITSVTYLQSSMGTLLCLSVSYSDAPWCSLDMTEVSKKTLKMLRK